MTFVFSSATFGNLKENPKHPTKTKLYYGFIPTSPENSHLDSSASSYLKREIDKVDSPSDVHFNTVVRNIIHKFKIIDFGALLLVQNNLYGAVLGDVDIKILRNQKLSTLCSGGGNTTFLSGKLLALDIVIVATKSFFLKFSESMLNDYFNDGLEVGITKLKSATPFPDDSLKAFFIQPAGAPSLEVVKISPQKIFGFFENTFKKVRSYLPKSVHLDSNSETRETALPKNEVSGSVGVILISLLIISILFGGMRRNQVQKVKEETEVASLVEHKVNEAQSIFSLNPLRARELITQAKVTLNAYEKENGNIQVLMEKISEAERLILGEYKSDMELFFDLTLFSEGFRGGKLKASGNYLYVFDEAAKKIVSIDVESKRSEIVAGPSLLGEVGQIIPLGSKILYLKTDGLYDLDGKKLVEKDFDKEGIVAEYLGNIYFLDKKNSQIVKFMAQGNSFDGGVSWLDDSLDKIDLTNAEDLVADGFLWVLLGDGEVVKLAQGKKIKFSFKGLNSNDFSAKILYTKPDLAYLYLVDPERGKMIVTGKDGGYKALYYSDLLKEVLGMVVFEKSKKAYFSTGEKLLYLDLEHMGYE